MTTATALAFCAGCLFAATVVELGVAASGRRRVLMLGRRAIGVSEALVRAEREGLRPATPDRRMLLLAGAGVGLVAGATLFGPMLGLLLTGPGAWVAARALRMKRERYQRAVERGSPAVALALADGLGGGHSLRGALAEAAQGVDGAAGRELRRVVAELALGARTDSALEAMRARVPSPAVETIVAAALLQNRVGGDLPRLLRDCARAFEDQAIVEGEARAATAQARFTGLLVVLLPLAGALLSELASPGFLRALVGSALGLVLVGSALALQLGAALLIHRLGTVRA